MTYSIAAHGIWTQSGADGDVFAWADGKCYTKPPHHFDGCQHKIFLYAGSFTSGNLRVSGGGQVDHDRTGRESSRRT